jgi:malonyl-CoA O-methyltransferase
MSERNARIARAFSARAAGYDAAATLQRRVAHRLAERIETQAAAPPRRILEIGCGTGFLSLRLAQLFPDSDLLLTDIAPPMLRRCRSLLGEGHRYRVLDGERPDGLDEQFDLIASSLAFQWFTDLRGGLRRLSRLLAPGGRMSFATLGSGTFAEWRQVHLDRGLDCGVQNYPGAQDLPWPEGLSHRVESESALEAHATGVDFVRSLKALGAHEPAAGHRPLPPGTFRRLLASLDNGFSVSYQLLYGEIYRNQPASRYDHPPVDQPG